MRGYLPSRAAVSLRMHPKLRSGFRNLSIALLEFCPQANPCKYSKNMNGEWYLRGSEHRREECQCSGRRQQCWIGTHSAVSCVHQYRWQKQQHLYTRMNKEITLNEFCDLPQPSSTKTRTKNRHRPNTAKKGTVLNPGWTLRRAHQPFTRMIGTCHTEWTYT